MAALDAKRTDRFVRRSLRGAAALAIAVTVAAGGSAGASGAPSRVAPSDWPQFQGSPAHQGMVVGDAPAPPLRRLWRFTARAHGERTGLSGAVLVNGSAVAVGEHGVYRIDSVTGALQWRIRRNGGPICMPAAGEAGGRAILVYTEGNRRRDSAVVAVDLGTRRDLWRQPLKNVSASGVTIDGGLVLLGDRVGRLYGFDLATGSPAPWSPEPLAAGVIDAPPAASSGTAYAVSRDPATSDVEVVAVDESSGKVRWVHKPRFASGTGSAVATSGDRVFYALGSEQQVHAAARLTGIDDWTVRTRDTFSPLSSPATTAGRVFVLSTSTANSVLYAFDAATGARLWDFQFQDGAIRSSPILEGDMVYAGLDDGRVVAVDALSGIEVWEDHTGSGGIGPLAAADGVLVAGKRGVRGGLIAFGPNPGGRLLHVVSPTVLHIGPDLLRYAIALLSVFVVSFGAAFILRRRASATADPRGGPSPEGA